MRRVLLAVLWMTVAAWFPRAVAATSEGELVVYGNENKPPKVFLRDGSPQGILVDVLRALETETGLRFSVQLLPWKRAVAMAEAGHGGVIGFSRTTERERIFNYSTVMYHEDIVLATRRDGVFEYAGVESLRNRRVGVRRGAVYGDDFAAAAGTVFQIDEDAGSLEDRLKKLLAGRIDVAIDGPGERGVRQVIAASPSLASRQNEIVILPTLFRRDSNHIAFLKTTGREAELAAIDAGLARLWANGVIQAIEARWMAGD